MPPIKFQLNQTRLGGDVFEEFQDGRHDGQLGYWNGTILPILNLCVTVMPPIKFQLNRTGLGGDVFEEFQDGRRVGQLGYLNRTILAILNLCVTVMPLRPSWILEWNDFSNFESLVSL